MDVRCLCLQPCLHTNNFSLFHILPLYFNICWIFSKWILFHLVPFVFQNALWIGVYGGITIIVRGEWHHFCWKSILSSYWLDLNFYWLSLKTRKNVLKLSQLWIDALWRDEMLHWNSLITKDLYCFYYLYPWKMWTKLLQILKSWQCYLCYDVALF